MVICTMLPSCGIKHFFILFTIYFITFHHIIPFYFRLQLLRQFFLWCFFKVFQYSHTMYFISPRNIPTVDILEISTDMDS